MDADREAVRRRLYGRGATEDDLRRYRALAPAGAGEAAPSDGSGSSSGGTAVEQPAAAKSAELAAIEQPDGGPTDPAEPAGDGLASGRRVSEDGAAPAVRRRVRPRLALGALGLAVLLGVALLPGVVGRAPVALPSAPPTLRQARSPDLPDVAFADAGTVFTRIGDGSELVPLDTDVVPATGAMTIALAPALRAPIGWRVIRSGAASSVTTDQVLATSTSAAARGAPVLLRFEGAAPNRIAVDAPDGERWTLVVTFLRGRSG